MVSGFTEEQDLFRSSMRKFVNKEIVPRANKIGKQEEIPRDLWKKICDLGIMAIIAPGKYGGQPVDSTLLGIAAEEVGRGDVSLAATLIPNIYFCMLLQNAPLQVQDKWFPPVIRGDKLSCLAVTEPECGTDAPAMKMSAKREGDYYILNGEKTSVGWGMYADVATVLAKTDPQAGAKGVSCFVLPLDFPGISKSSSPSMGLKPVNQGSLVLDNVRIPKDSLIGQEGKGLSMIMKVADVMRILVALISIGAAEAVMDETIEYAKQRIAFGQSLAKFKGISLKIAEDATLLEAARWLCYGTLRSIDQGERCAKEIAMCKWWCMEVALRVIYDTLLMHGQRGYSNQYPLEQRLRDIIGYEIAEATPQILKLTICEEILGKELRPFC